MIGMGASETMAKATKKTTAKKKPSKGTYDAGSISVLSQLEAIRRSPALHVGSSGSEGVNHMVYEIVGNGLDEVANGHATEVHIVVSKDLSTVTVTDNGRGIPVGPHPKIKGKNSLTLVFTEMNAGGKFDDKAYKISLGTHGQGAAIVNALSKKLSVRSYRSGAWWGQEFALGKPVRANPERLKLSKGAGRGTSVTFTPDLSCFDKGSTLNLKSLTTWLNSVSWFIPAKIVLEHTGSAPVVIHRPEGVESRFRYDCERMGAEPVCDPFVIRNNDVDVVVGWCSSGDSAIFSSVNAAETEEGGIHATALLDGVFAALKEHAKRGDTFTKESVKAGMVAVINIRLHGAKYSSQHKSKLVGPDEAKDTVKDALLSGKTSLVAFLKKNKDACREIIDRANSIATITKTFQADKKLAASLRANVRGKITLPLLLKPSTTNKPEERNLYITEGKSASGGCIRARDPRCDEILALTGKPENVWRSGKANKAFTNDRVLDILKSIGYDPKTPGKYRVGKVIILTDADPDGQHISALVLGILQKVAPDLFDQGRVFRVDDALFAYRTDTTVYRAKSLIELQKMVPGKFDSSKVTRLKGLGEIQPDVLKAMAFDPTTRVLIPISGVKTAEDHTNLIGMLGEEPAARKALLGIA